MEVKLEWKNNNKEYLKAMEIFLDKASNIQNESLKAEVIGAALKCDEILTKIALEQIKKA